MENATKALVMAGSILISIIILAILLYAFNVIKQYPEEQEEQAKIEQLSKFNTEYESYNKEKMYGTDIITVLNKANNNNKLYADNEGAYDIDIEIKLLTDITASALIYSPSLDENGNLDGKIDVSQTENEKGLPNYAKKQFDGKLGVILVKGTFTLLENVLTIQNLLALSDEIVIYPDEKKDGLDPEWNYTKIDGGFKQFKRKLFKCTGIEYNSTTGRVNKMYFEEIT